MKKGFTLVEMLVVVVVLATLMAMAFRLSSIGADESARNTAVARLQRLENCLSGYYAAYGSYPPVRLHGSRNYLLGTCIHGIQGNSETPLRWNWFDKTKHKVKDKKNEYRDWKQVEAACRAQPVDCASPFPDEWAPFLNEMGQVLSQKSSKLGFSGSSLASALSPYQDEVEWRRVQAFKFGLMSFLLPRYLVMMRGELALYDDQEQWQQNNEMPCNPITGDRFDNRNMDDSEQKWNNLREDALSSQGEKRARVQNIPSQAVCARWMPNLEGICWYSRNDVKFFGIDIRDEDSRDDNQGGISQHIKPEIHVPGDRGSGCTSSDSGSGGGASGQYVLDRVTVFDGFTREDEDDDDLREYGEFFYYSPEPYQSYVLWSAGPNGRTFPPWVPRESLSSDARSCVEYWTEDDIVIMSH